MTSATKHKALELQQWLIDSVQGDIYVSVKLVNKLPASSILVRGYLRGNEILLVEVTREGYLHVFEKVTSLDMWRSRGRYSALHPNSAESIIQNVLYERGLKLNYGLLKSKS